MCFRPYPQLHLHASQSRRRACVRPNDKPSFTHQKTLLQKHLQCHPARTFQVFWIIGLATADDDRDFVVPKHDDSR